MASTVETFCDELARSHLLGPQEVHALRNRWQRIAGPRAGDLDRFTRWLVTTRTLSEYQVKVIERGGADQLAIGPYQILDRVGKGRMAGVYRAAHRTGQTVAIKVLPPSRALDPPTLARFHREARLALQLKHPNIVRTFQTGEANGLHYLVMEYLEGEPLDEVLARRGPLPPGEAVRLAHQALLGLGELHARGLIHRDIKPANLMLVGGRRESTLQSTLKILDIGTGRALFNQGEPGVELTGRGQLLGTPEYMAPEQGHDPRAADIRSDIYSVGCVLYHALTGQPPFTDPNQVRVLVLHATEPPRPARAFNPAVPDGLQKILNRLLAKDPARRYPTPERAAQALQTFLTAGSQAVPIEQDPAMRSYLQWLETEVLSDNTPIPEKRKPQGGERRKNPSRPPSARPARRPPPEAEAEPLEPWNREPERPVERQQPHPAGEPTILGLDRRDFLMLAIGFGTPAALLGSGLAVWSALRYLRRAAAANR